MFVQAQAGVGRNIKDNEVLKSCIWYNDYSKSYVHFKNLPKLVAEIEELKKQILNQKWK
jgi:UDP-3-O-[3-hydroxymyristoyl] glucosamine N-acyltransferase